MFLAIPTKYPVSLGKGLSRNRINLTLLCFGKDFSYENLNMQGKRCWERAINYEVPHFYGTPPKALSHKTAVMN